MKRLNQESRVSSLLSLRLRRSLKSQVTGTQISFKKRTWAMNIASMWTGLLSGLWVYICTPLLLRLRPVRVKIFWHLLTKTSTGATGGPWPALRQWSQQRPLLAKPGQSQQLREAYGAEVCSALQPAHNKISQVTLVQFTSVSCYEDSTLCWVD